MSDLHETIQEILHGFAANVQGSISVGRDIQFDLYERLIITAFTDAGYVSPENAKKVQEMVNHMVNLANGMAQTPTIRYIKPNKSMTKAQNLMTGQEWYDRFEREYHMRADWIAADEEMGDDAEHDVLSAAKKAAGL